ncbi:MAG: Penicillin-binding protein 4* [Acinetobacter bereziniae]|uniref:Penicillin-binding protein 4 n=1 Tax=Acinetobacter bereziniae TaxID=106648 RepID=A0A833UNL1_ACIBZ|nr:MAG: Penicillin-binding protein 4* [Acinetobacter bereziniae]
MEYFLKINMKILIFILIMPNTIIGCAYNQKKQSKPKSFHEKLTIIAKKNNICNLAIAVIKNRKIVALDSVNGCAKPSKQDTESIFQAASLSKPVFAYAVMKLVAEKRLELDTPLIKYLDQGYQHQYDPLKKQPNDLVTDPRIQMITARMVLNHTSGLPNWASGPLRFNAKPGEKWIYSGEGYLLLQRAVENVTGMPLNKLMKNDVFDPLKMVNSDFVWNVEVEKKLVIGTKANAQPRKSIKLTEPISAFSLYTTAEDYGKFLEVVLSDNKLLQAITESAVMVDPKLNLRWGLGWGVENNQKKTYLWHWGNNPGYRSFVLASVETGDGFVFLTNSENGLYLAQPIADMILPDQHKVFEFKMLKSDVTNILCNTVRLCF